MNRPRIYLSPAPPTGPALDRHTRSEGRCRPVRPSQRPRRTPHDGRSTPLPTHTQHRVESFSTAARFAEQTVRLTLEALDRKRPVTQLRTVLEPSLLDMVRVLAASAVPGRELGTATLGALRLQAVTRDSAEVFASYTRGPRVFALAAHIRRRRGVWRMDALRIA